MNITIITRLTFFFALFPVLLSANGEGGKSIFDLFDTPGILQAELVMDFEDLESNRKNEKYMSALLRFGQFSISEQQWQVEVRVRGRFRRMNCDMPPLKLRFDKDHLKARNLQAHNSFKLVTHCLDKKEGNENVLKEYLAYQLYAQLTDQSYRAQLVWITYKNAGDGSSSSYFGILLEDTDQLEERLDGKECEDCYNLPEATFQVGNLPRHALFQYMIGNSDWSVHKLRNLKVFRLTNGQNIAVPYDFDFSGLVNASYAIPNPDYQLNSVKDRVFLAPAGSREELLDTFEHFRARKEALLGLVNNFGLLDRQARRELARYLGSFFRELDQGMPKEDRQARN